LNAFQIPYIAVYDEDPIPEEIRPGRSGHDPAKYDTAKHLFNENERIEAECNKDFTETCMVPGKFEYIVGISKSHAEKVGKPYAAVEHLSNEQNSIASELDKLVRKVYTT